MSSVRPSARPSDRLCLLASISKDDGREHLRLRLRCGRFDGYRQTTLRRLPSLPRTLCANFRLLKERYENTINALLIFPSTLALALYLLFFPSIPFLPFSLFLREFNLPRDSDSRESLPLPLLLPPSLLKRVCSSHPPLLFSPLLYCVLRREWHDRHAKVTAAAIPKRWMRFPQMASLLARLFSMLHSLPLSLRVFRLHPPDSETYWAARIFPRAKIGNLFSVQLSLREENLLF